MIEMNGRYFMPHDFEHEIWRAIPNFSNYLISNFSRIKTLQNYNNLGNKIMKPQLQENKKEQDRYYVMLVNDDGKLVHMRMDRLQQIVKFKHIHTIAVQPEEYVRYRRFSEFIYDAF